MLSKDKEKLRRDVTHNIHYIDTCQVDVSLYLRFSPFDYEMKADKKRSPVLRR